ncbi:MAG: hypothetical protein LBU65_09120 [Planctomycetaceae bacterium]|jgi:hypothetical protein|nr:hypothetical protein [Planctomycetaceae bacterium]
MQTSQQVIDTYFLDMRHNLLELCAFFDRYDVAVKRSGQPTNIERYRMLTDALSIVADKDNPNRAETLLNLLSDQT